MKSYVLTVTFCLCIAYLGAGKIINGYEENISSARSSLKHLLALPKAESVSERLEAVKEFILYYELTKTLLEQFEMISPALHHHIDTLTDYKGRPVNVYVKFVPKSRIHEGTLATTNMNLMKDDRHGYQSEYGPLTVSVKITILKLALLLLAHEFGHVSYQVPNLASYVDFFYRNYRDHQMKADFLGHKPNDPSGQSAQAFEKIFQQELAKFNQTREDRFPCPMLILSQISKSLNR